MILIVDHISVNLNSLKQTLENNKFEVETATSVAEAQKMASKKEYGLIILDLELPDLDRYEFAAELSKDAKTKRTSLLYLTRTNIDNNHIRSDNALVSQNYLTKPVDAQELLSKVKLLLAENREGQEKQGSISTQKESLNAVDSINVVAKQITSHDLKTPLTSAKGYIQLMDRAIGKADIESLRVYTKKANLQLNKLNDLITEYAKSKDREK